MQLVLASTSQSRKELLERLNIPFVVAPSNVDETPLNNESPDKMVTRLAKEKAQAVAPLFSNALIIGADQVGVLDGTVLTKPITKENAITQLQALSGKRVRFFIGLSLLNTATNKQDTILETYDVVFRSLTQEVILRYLEKENALQCAGSLKVEGLGIALLEKLIGDDYNALIGLPLIRLTSMLQQQGVSIV